MLKKSDGRLETLLLMLNESDLLESDDIDLLFSHFSVIQEFGVQKLIVYADILSMPGADKKEALYRLLKQNILKKYESLPSHEKFECFVLSDYDSCAPISSSGFSVYFVLGLGGRKELHTILSEFVESQKGAALQGELTPEMISSRLKIPFEPDFILLEKSALADFMIWQTTYSEYGFFEKEFQKITDSDLVRLLESFNKRERRFGV